MSFLFEILIIVLLIILNGAFAMSELAMVSARRTRLEAMAEAGSAGARTALRLSANPGRFLSSVQIGITLIGVLAGAYSGATLAEPLALYLADFPLVARYAQGLSIAIVVGLVTYGSLIIGELVPKQIALRNPEAVASLVSRPMAVVAIVAAPLIWLLETTSRLVLGALGLSGSDRETVTEEEIRAIIAEGNKSGILEQRETELLTGVMRFGDRKIRAIMTPRPDVEVVDLDWPVERILDTVRSSDRSRFPVYRDDINEIQGVVQVKDILDQVMAGGSIDLAPLVKPVTVVPDTLPALSVLDLLEKAPIHLAVVVDEYGSFEGIVTAADILVSIVGSVTGFQDDSASAVQRADGSWLFDGDMPVDDVAARIGVREIDDPERDYDTLAGFVLTHSRALPTAGYAFTFAGWRFEVVDMDGRRIDKVLAEPVKAAA
jgi:putative hemolysin